MKKSVLRALFLTLTLPVAACLPGSGDTGVDRNRDGVTDSDSGSVRGIDEVVLGVPSSPTCVVFGSLYNGYDGTPLANVTVDVATGKGQLLTATTDEFGGFVIVGVSQGAYRMNIAADGMIPVADNLGCQAVGNTDNNTVFAGRIYLLPTDSTASFTAYTVDGDAVANQTLYVEMPTYLVDGRANIGSAAGPAPAGIRTVAAVTNAQGIAEVTGVPSPAKLWGMECREENGGFINPATSNNFVFYRVLSSTVDIDADGTFDFCGAYQTFAGCDAVRAGGKLRLAPYTRLNTPGLAVVGGNVTDRDAIVPANAGTPTQNNTPVVLQNGESLALIFSRPVDITTADFALVNEFTNNQNGSLLDNSTPFRPGQAFPLDPVTAVSKPVDGSPTLVIAADPSNTVITLTPATGLAQGRIYYLTGSIAALDTVHGTASSEIVQFPVGRWAAFIQPDPAAAVTVDTIYLESSATNGTGGFNNVVVVFNQPVRGYDAGGDPYVLVCFDEELQGNGFANNPAGSLDHFECPQAGHQLVAARDVDDGSGGQQKGLMRAYLRSPNGGDVRPGFGRIYQFRPSGPLIGRNGGALRVHFPMVNGAPHIDGNQATRVDGSAIAVGTVVQGDFTVAPVSANAKLDFGNNPTPSLQ